MKQSEQVVLHQETVERSFIERQELYEQNVLLRDALKALLDLDDKRPVDPTWWRRHWDDARERAKALLAQAAPLRKDPRP